MLSVLEKHALELVLAQLTILRRTLRHRVAALFSYSWPDDEI